MHGGEGDDDRGGDAGDGGAMTWPILAMYAVAAVLGLAGAGLLLALARPSGPAKVYIFRMAGIMALTAAAVLAFAATSLWQWNVEP